jgi:hypothetical protein
MPARLTIHDWRRALETAAMIVDRHGAAYLPAFEALERAVAEREASQSALDRARRLARSSADHAGKSGATR